MALTRQIINSINSVVKKIVPESSSLYRSMFSEWMEVKNRVVQKLQFLNNFRLKDSKVPCILRDLFKNHKVLEQVQ
jgi:hypothetical protein